MAPTKMGRPPSDNPKDFKFHMRMDKETLEKLDKCAQELSLSRSDVIRKGIDLILDGLKKK